MAQANPAVVQATVIGDAPSPQEMVVGAVGASPHPKLILENGFGDLPQMHHCQWCGAQEATKVSHNVSLGTHIACVGLCVIGCDLGCCLVPYCINSTKQVNHKCGSCGQVVGIKKFIV